MAITKNTQYGNINIAIEAIASLAGGVVSECYGVVGMASQNGKLFKRGRRSSKRGPFGIGSLYYRITRR